MYQFYESPQIALEQFELGNLNALPRAYCVLVRGEKNEINRLGTALTCYFQTVSVKRLLSFDKWFRGYTSMEWYADWTHVSMDCRNYFNTDADYLYALILGSFHPNGYFRQTCICKLAEFPNTIPFIALRINDWVKNIRILAGELVLKQIQCCKLEELWNIGLAIMALKRGFRKEEQIFLQLKEAVLQRMKEQFQQIDWTSLSALDITTRYAFYRFIIEERVFPWEFLNQLLSRERNLQCQTILITGILKDSACPLEQIDQYLSSKSAMVRKKALERKFELLKNSWQGLESFLLDNNAFIRDYTRFILRNYSDIDVLTYYCNQLDTVHYQNAIVGIGECQPSQEQYRLLLLPFLQSDCVKTVRVTLLALGKLLVEQNEALFLQYLFSPEVGIAKAAYLSLLKNKIRCGAQVLYQGLYQAKFEHTMRYLLLLLIQEDSWERLPYLLEVYQYRDLNVRRKIQMAVADRNYMKVISKKLADKIGDALKRNRYQFSEALIENVEFDLKYQLIQENNQNKN